MPVLPFQSGYRLNSWSRSCSRTSECCMGWCPCRHQHSSYIVHRKHPWAALVLPSPWAAVKGELHPYSAHQWTHNLLFHVPHRFLFCQTSPGWSRACQLETSSTSVWETWIQQNSELWWTEHTWTYIRTDMTSGKHLRPYLFTPTNHLYYSGPSLYRWFAVSICHI